MERDISAELKRAAEQRSAVEPPDFEQLVAGARRRQVTRRTMAAVSVCVLAVAAGAVVWNTAVGVGNGSGQRVASAAAVEYFEVPTGAWQGGGSVLAANTEGTLRFTPEGCPYLATGGPPQYVIFPADARGVITDDGKRSVIDPDGYVYGTEGDNVEYGGGSAAKEPKDYACIVGEKKRAFSVQEPPSSRQIDLGG